MQPVCWEQQNLPAAHNALLCLTPYLLERWERSHQLCGSGSACVCGSACVAPVPREIKVCPSLPVVVVMHGVQVAALRTHLCIRPEQREAEQRQSVREREQRRRETEKERSTPMLYGAGTRNEQPPVATK